MILVTGASGFLGQHLVRYLSAQGAGVRALYNSKPPSAELSGLRGIEWVQADLLDVYDVGRVMQGISQVYHCAAIVSFQPSERNKMLHFNTESTANIVNAALEHHIKKLVYVSSVSALSKTGENKEITEDQEWDDNKYNSAYGLSKYLAEMEVWRGIGEGLSAAIINPGIILGAGDWEKGSPRLMKVAHSEFPFYTKGVTSWADADDVVKIMTMLMQSEIEGERFIVSAGNFSFREIFTRMANALNKKPPRIHANNIMTSLLWRGSSIFLGKKMLITRETAMSAHGFAIYNNSKLLNAFPGFSYISMDTTIDKMARYFTNSL
jgi:dihydroflavonol-4-reductase